MVKQTVAIDQQGKAYPIVFVQGSSTQSLETERQAISFREGMRTR